MKYCIQAWSSHLVNDIETLEKVIEYHNCRQKRQRGDLIAVYKILTGKEDMDPACLFQFASQEMNLHGHHLKLYKKPRRLIVKNTSLRELSVCGTRYQTML